LNSKSKPSDRLHRNHFTFSSSASLLAFVARVHNDDDGTIRKKVVKSELETIVSKIGRHCFQLFSLVSLLADAKDGKYSDNNTAVMGLLLKPRNFSFHSSAATTSRRRTISNRLIFITLFAVALALQVYGANAVVDQSEQQDAELKSSSSTCETKTVDEALVDPVSCSSLLKVWQRQLIFLSFQFYDASEVTVTAARKLSEFIIEASKGNKKLKFVQSQIEAFTKQANIFANEALMADENLLAVALAAPSVPLAVVQFRGKVDNRLPANHTFLNIFWRELGIAWNQSDGAQFWGAPFKDCGPLQGRWLWPFSVTVIEQHVK
jgi:hypothetical protein